jgi:hypothetical protein
MSLRKLGAALSLGHLIVLYQWAFDAQFAAQSLNDSLALCWPFFQNCAAYRALLQTYLPALLVFYGVAALFSLASYSFSKLSRFASTALFVTCLLKLLIFLGDMRFMGNYHYMLWWLTGAFLFIPNKKSLLPVLLVSFYFFAGLLKFNQEWLTGAALLRRPIIEGPLLGAGLYYVILLELIIVPLVLFFPRLRWFVLAQLFFFHAFSWHIVGYLYPLLMACMLVVFIDPVPHWRELLRGSRVALFYLGAFFLAQLIPLLIPGDSSLSGEGRLASLNMFDAKVACVNSFELSFGKQHNETHDPMLDLEPRIRCDPYVHYQWASQQCDRGKSLFRFYAKKESDSQYKQMIELKDFCENKPSYYWWKRNEWIKIAEDTTQFRPSFAGDSLVDPKIDADGVLHGQGPLGEWFYSAELSGYPAWIIPSKGTEGILPFIPGSNRIFGIDIQDGSSRWMLPLPGSVRFSPALSSGKILYVITQRYDLKEYVTAIRLREARQLYSFQLPFSVVSFELVTDANVIARTVTGTRYQLSAHGWEAL